MAKEGIHSDFSDFSCRKTCDENCIIRDNMLKLQQHLIPVPSDASTELIQAFFKSYQELLCQSSRKKRKQYAPSFALPALFDLVVSAKYAAKMLSDGGWVYCGGHEQEKPALYFPFLNTCPRCSMRRGIKPLVKSNKPQSAIIGDISGDTTLQILSELLSWIDSSVKIGKNSDRQADVDFVLYDQKVFVLGEVKSSPLVIDPLEISLERPMTEVRNGDSVLKRDHTPATSDITATNISLYIPHKNLRIHLGSYNNTNWPYQRLTEYISDANNLAVLLSAWKELFDVYIETLKPQEKRQNQKENRRWLTCGCGGKVDDSKNAPGMDRTDDIKKGTYQVLKFGTYYKEKYPRRYIRTVLASNFFPHRKFDRYWSEMRDVLWTRDMYSVTLRGKRAKEMVAFQKHNLFHLYDALLCFTQSLYNDQHLQEITSLEKFMKMFCS